MGRYTGPSCRLCRREGMKLFLKGIKCTSPKCAIEKRAFPPGQHGQGRIRLSNYGIQLREKQKVKRMYGVWERQFSRYFRLAQKSRGVTGQMLLSILERRLDNVVYRLGLASSRPEAREMIGHRLLQVNGKRVDIPSYSVNTGDVIQAIAKGENGSARFKATLEQTKDSLVPSWLQVDAANFKGIIVRFPQKEDVGVVIQEQLIVELYSK